MSELTANAPLGLRRTSGPSVMRLAVVGARVLARLIVFTAAALAAAWFAGAWTPPGKPVPGAAWFASASGRTHVWGHDGQDLDRQQGAGSAGA